MGAWNFCVLSAGENLHAHKIPRFRGVVFCFFFGGGGRSADFIFMGEGILIRNVNLGMLFRTRFRNGKAKKGFLDFL